LSESEKGEINEERRFSDEVEEGGGDGPSGHFQRRIRGESPFVSKFPSQGKGEGVRHGSI